MALKKNNMKKGPFKMKGYSYPGTSPAKNKDSELVQDSTCLLYTSPSPRDATLSRMPSSA